MRTTLTRGFDGGVSIPGNEQAHAYAKLSAKAYIHKLPYHVIDKLLYIECMDVLDSCSALPKFGDCASRHPDKPDRRLYRQ